MAYHHIAGMGTSPDALGREAPGRMAAGLGAAWGSRRKISNLTKALLKNPVIIKAGKAAKAAADAARVAGATAEEAGAAARTAAEGVVKAAQGGASTDPFVVPPPGVQIPDDGPGAGADGGGIAVSKGMGTWAKVGAGAIAVVVAVLILRR